MTDIVIAIVQKNDDFAFLQRVNGLWTFPSGKVEQGESLEDACYRETLEETGVAVDNIKYLGERALDDKTLHYYLCDYMAGSLICREPENFLSVGWKSASEILQITSGALFEPVRAHLEFCALSENRAAISLPKNQLKL